jgi:hypothetical protein
VDGVFSRGDVLAAENAKLRVSLAAGEMTEEGKKVATITMAALDAVIAAKTPGMKTALDALDAARAKWASQVNSQEPEDKQ